MCKPTGEACDSLPWSAVLVTEGSGALPSSGASPTNFAYSDMSTCWHAENTRSSPNTTALRIVHILEQRRVQRNPKDR